MKKIKKYIMWRPKELEIIPLDFPIYAKINLKTLKITDLLQKNKQSKIKS